MSGETLAFEQKIKVPPESVYYAFTNATALREWLCDVSTVNPHTGGRVYMSWNSGFYTAGEYLALDPGKCVEFSWQGRGEPGATRIRVSLEGQDGGTRLSLEHSGFGPGTEWQKAIQEARDGWAQGLENLVTVLETGQDIRFTLRPMLGISLSDFNAEIAGHLGIPVTEGIRIDGTLEGMGAREAGLEKNDVLVKMDGKLIDTYSSIGSALLGHRAGDVIEVDFYRGPEKKTVMMELSRRPLPEIPFDPVELAAQVRKIYEPLNEELAQVFTGVTDQEAAYKAAPDQWSALEVVAHLLLGERYNSQFIIDLMGGQERWTDDFPPNTMEETRAIVAAYPTIAEILEENRRGQVTKLAMIEMLPPDFVARKASYWRLAYGLLQGGLHDRQHFDQIREAIQAAKNP
jgi:uncharacterized protein YndB with AHSA1/START domain